MNKGMQDELSTAQEKHIEFDDSPSKIIVSMGKKVIVTTLILILLIASAGLAVTAKLYYDSQKKIALLEKTASGSPQTSGLDDKKIVENVARHITLPKEEPKVITVSNVELLAKEQPFFTQAKNGDKLLVYSEKVILYDAITDRLIDIAHIRISPQPEVRTPTRAPVPTKVSTPFESVFSPEETISPTSTP